jgi:hypothetical protein
LKRLIFILVMCLFLMFVVGFRGCSPADKAPISLSPDQNENEEVTVETTSDDNADSNESSSEDVSTDSDEDASSDVVADASEDSSDDSDEDQVDARPGDTGRESGRDRRDRPDRRRWMGQELSDEDREKMREMMGRFRPGMFGSEGPMGPFDPNQQPQPELVEESLEALNLNNVEMRNVLQKIADWTGKPIIPATDEIMQLKITIYSPE